MTKTVNTYKNDLIPQGDGRANASYDSSGSGVIAKAMRRCRDYHGMSYNKLLSLRWEAASFTPYGATDGRRLILNPRGIDKLCQTTNPVGYTAFLLLHEALHALLNHGTRLSKFTNREQANIAADYIINAMIRRINLAAMREHGLKQPPFPMIEGCLIDEAKSGDKEVEKLYGEIMSDLSSEEPEPEPPTNEDGESEDNPEEGEPEDGADDGEGGNGDDTGNDEGNGEGADEDPESGTGTGEGESESEGEGEDSNSGDAGAGDDEGEGGGSGKPKSDSEILGEDFVGSPKGADTFEPEVNTDEGETPRDVAEEIDRENDRIFMNDEINEAAGLGSGGGRIDLQNNQDRGELDTPWEDIIRDWMTYSTYAGWVSPFNQQVYQATGMVSAGRGGKSISKLVFIVDTSGSMCGSALRDIMGKVQVVLDELQPRSTAIIPCDHMVRTVHDVELGGFVPETLDGGGGTMFQPALDYAEDHYPDADGIVFLTDGYACDLSSMEEPNIPLLWLTYGLDAERFPFGDAISVRLFD